MLSPAEIVALLAPSTPDLGSRIGSIKKTWTDSGKKITGSFFFIRMRDGKPTVDDLITVAHARMVNFAIPRSRINEAIEDMNNCPGLMDPWVLLVTEARDLFIRTKQETGRSGELGELLLYMLLEWSLKAPIVACKMYLKTAQMMPVYGTDGIHLGYEDDCIVLYWGESKLHKEMSSALSDIISSISEQIREPEKRANEVRIIKSNLNFDGMRDDARNALKNYFNPYKEESNRLKERYACLAGFDSVYYEKAGNVPVSSCEEEFCKLYEQRIDKIFKTISEKIMNSEIKHLSFSYFLLPFPSVEQARDQFQKRLWGAA